MKNYANTIIILGIVLIIAGILLKYTNLLQYFGRLPGDIYIKKDNFSFFFPISTMIILSLVLSLFAKFLRK